jgi:phosphoribosylanthranilate isomerase
VVDSDAARAIVQALPPFIKVVGLFVNADPAWIRSLIEAVPLDLLQFHGRESPAQCAQFRRPYVKSISVRPGVDVAAEARRYDSASGLLLDAWHRELPGGTGRAFDWSLVPTGLGRPMILAGGLTPDNVAAAIEQVRPFAVDVSGGVEARKGIKDEEKMAAFVRSVQSVAWS